MTIHSEHPFVEPPAGRNPLRRLRGRLPAPVTVWAGGDGTGRSGLTVSSVLVADGDPGEVLGLIDADSDFADRLGPGVPVAVSLLGQAHRHVADVFAGLAPSPGGMFRTGRWSATGWGPVLADAPGWIGARLVADEPDHAGWALLVRARIEHVELPEVRDDPLAYLRGRYGSVSD